MASTTSLPLREKAKLLRILAVSSLVLARQAVLGVFQHGIRSYAYRVNIYGPVLQYVFGRLSESHRRALGQPATSGETIRKYCKSRGLEHHVQKTSEHASLYWIGEIPQGPESKILFYLHGGGYFHSIQPSHIKFLQQCASKMPVPISIVVLEYTLTAESPWPAQLQSAISAITHLLRDYSPSQIILGGDSAGGHLILSLFSHILHPDQSPCSDNEPINLKEPFAGAFLMSPWVSTATSAPSYSRLASRDHLTKSRIEIFTQALVASSSPDQPPRCPEDLVKDPFLSPLNAPPGWWNDLGSTVQKLQLVTGTWEIFFDDDCAMARTFLQDVKGTEVSFNECGAAIHAGGIVDAALGISDSPMSVAIWTWMRNVFHSG